VRAGFSGVLNILTTDDSAEVGRCFAPATWCAISFTGFHQKWADILMATKRSVNQEASLELGGNAPFIVFDDA
jgi:succinate-semialdehyde dehydrogenase/glutarate-semialdehyde dehydrogenase